jgi:hypothetical protein
MTTFGIGLTAFYWLPVVVELPWVSAGHQPIVNYHDHFPSVSQLIWPTWGYGYSESGFSDGISFQIGITQWIIFGISSSLLLWMVLNRHAVFFKTSHGGLLLVGVCTSICTTFLMLSSSNWLWIHVPMLSSVQHPWRFLGVIGISTSLLTSILAELRFGKLIVICLVFLAIINTRNYQRPMSFDYASDSVLFNNEAVLDTGDVSSEFLPIWANAVNKASLFDPNLTVSERRHLSNAHQIAISIDQSQEFIVNKYYYPSWQVWSNGTKLETHMSASGLLAVNLQPGDYILTISLGQTFASMLANSISVVFFIGFVVFAAFGFRNSSNTMQN